MFLFWISLNWNYVSLELSQKNCWIACKYFFLKFLHDLICSLDYTQAFAPKEQQVSEFVGEWCWWWFTFWFDRGKHFLALWILPLHIFYPLIKLLMPRNIKRMLRIRIWVGHWHLFYGSLAYWRSITIPPSHPWLQVLLAWLVWMPHKARSSSQLPLLCKASQTCRLNVNCSISSQLVHLHPWIEKGRGEGILFLWTVTKLKIWIQWWMR